MKNDLGTAGILLTVFIALIIGIAFLTSTANTVTDVTKIQTKTNETVSLTNSTFTEFANTNSVTVSALRYCANATAMTAGQYNFTASGTKLIGLPTTSSCADYTFKGSTYVEDSSARSVINLIILMFAIGLLGIGLMATKPLWETGLIK